MNLLPARRSLESLAARWQRWLFAPASPRALALFRIGWAAAMFADAVGDWAQAGLYAPERYHLPLVPWAVPLGTAGYQALVRIAAIGCAMTFVGLLPRLAAAVVSAANGYLLSMDLLVFRNHVYLGCLLGLLLSMSPCGNALSVDALARRLIGRRPAPAGCPAAIQVIKGQILIVYLWSVVNKLRPSFLDGWTLEQEIPHALGESPIARWLYEGGTLRPAIATWVQSDRAMAICSWIVVLVEAFLVVGLLRRRWRPYAAAAGLALHGTIFVSMGVLTFGLLMVSSYPLFLADSTAARPMPGASPRDVSRGSRSAPAAARTS